MPSDIPRTGWKITGQRPGLGDDGHGQPVEGVTVTFHLEGVGEFSKFIPQAKYSPNNVQAEIAAYAAQISQVHKLTG